MALSARLRGGGGARGRAAGATGLVTSNFLLRPAAGEFEERWAAVLFLP